MKKLQTLFCAFLCVWLAFAAVGCGNIFRDPNADVESDMQEVLDKVDFSADTEFSGTLNVAINYEEDQKIILDTLIEGFEAKYKNI